MIRCLILLAGLSLPGLQDKRLPVPDEAAQKAAEKLVRDVLAEDFARKTPAGRTALVQKLLRQGLESQNETAPCFVLFRLARDLSVAAGDPAGALQAVAELAARYQVHSVEMKGAALASIAKGARTPEEFVALAKGYLELVDEAIAADEVEAAEAAVSAGGQAARKGKDLPLASRLQARAKDCEELKGRTAQIRKAKDALVKNPDDPEAHQVLGLYLCVVRADWSAGLAHLVRAGDPALVAIARNDLAGPSEAGDQLAVGDAWWDLAEKEKDEAKTRFRSRAAFWYAQARDRLAGLTRVRVEKRLEGAPPLVLSPGTIDLLKLVDPVRDSVAGEWILEGTTLVCAREIPAARLQIPYIPPDEYDVVLVAERKSGIEAINLGLSRGDVQFHVVIDGFAKDGYMSGLSEIDGKLAYKNETTRAGALLANDKPSTIECAVRKTGVKMTVDGVVVFDWSGDFKRLSNFSMLKVPNAKAIYISGWESRYRFSKLTLTAVTGKGERLR